MPTDAMTEARERMTAEQAINLALKIASQWLTGMSAATLAGDIAAEVLSAGRQGYRRGVADAVEWAERYKP